MSDKNHFDVHHAELAKEIRRLDSVEQKKQLVSNFLEIFIDRTDFLEKVKEDSGLLKNSNGVFIDTFVKNTSEDLDYLGSKIIFRWVLLESDEKLDDQDFEDFYDLLKAEECKEGIIIIDGKRREELPEIIARKSNDREIFIKIKPAIDILQDKFFDFQSILAVEEIKFKIEMLNLLNYFALKIEEKAKIIVRELKEEILKLIKYDNTKAFLKHALSDDDPFELIATFKAIHNKTLKTGYGRHDLIHTLMVAKNSLEIFNLIYNKRTTIEAKLKRELAIELGANGELSEGEIQTALLVASLWHDTGYGIHEKDHAKKSVGIFTEHSKEIIEYIYPPSLRNENIPAIKGLIKRLIEYHSVGNDKKCDESLEVSIIRVADVLDTTFIRQTAEYLRKLVDDRRDPRDEFSKRDVLQHGFSFLLIDRVNLYYNPLSGKVIIDIKLNHLDDYERKILSKYEFHKLKLSLFGPAPSYGFIHNKFKDIKDQDLFEIRYIVLPMK